ncbi:Putative Sirtuin family, DHS-like NAD/FAD-binding domain superfamily [Septoria linicola]|uniref:Sirtuin family, DHS-like NAD/FAD-binding domain superfamily n=1 Tax=Septoria linicola TaxID=215465 RepID=A0A9Q9AF91_9PEZI|nr:Putative Sirtuin family, DHS-like NAD/FAD-binding domain superfamily [Septoria linicola]
MASTKPEALRSFHDLLQQSTRVMCLLGAGLSAASGLPTFRGAGGLWRSHDAISLASPTAFERDPALVWRFYSYRRHMALQVRPNTAHFALAELARRMPGFITLSQNVDGLSQRAGHPQDNLHLLHGTLFEVKCTDKSCGYKAENFTDPITASLDIPYDTTSNQARQDISDASVTLADIPLEQLPHCPQCTKSLLRPNVVWFGERLPDHVMDSIRVYLDESEKIDLIMVIGTGAKVYPAAGYISEARYRGARVCVVNTDSNDAPPGGWEEGDWFFQGDAAQLLPELLKPIIGDLPNL